MTDETKTNGETKRVAGGSTATAVRGVASREAPRGPRTGSPRSPRGGRRNETGSRARRGRAAARPEFEQRILSIRRVTRVVSGGRRFAFSVAMVLGDRKGLVGVGIGKAADTARAIEKATKDAKKNMIRIPMTRSSSIRHPVFTKYASSRVMINPAPGRGLVAGSSVRNVLELAGVKDIAAKIYSRSRNRLNNARAAIRALSQLRAPSVSVVPDISAEAKK